MSEEKYVVGQRYSMTTEMGNKIIRQGRPITSGKPDVARGRRLVKLPCSWEFWTTDGRKVEFTYEHGTFVASQSRVADPNRPEPIVQTGVIE